MAYTVTRFASVFGNKRVVGLDITADAATQTVDTGLAIVEWFSFGPQSMASNGVKHVVNGDASGGVSNGKYSVSGATTGDRYFVTVYGR